MFLIKVKNTLTKNFIFIKMLVIQEYMSDISCFFLYKVFEIQCVLKLHHSLDAKFLWDILNLYVT